MVEHKHVERLYLAKSEEEDSNIFVDTIPLPQHQYDGIRFLYRQYKKGKAGAILNDPSGYGKRVQSVLFLNAIQPHLELPILILCTDGKEQLWIQQFNKWTNLGPYVSIQKSIEIIKPVCVISTFMYISVVSRREWGVVVVDDNNVSRDVLRSGIKAKYKIWLTSLDMKKNLQTFSLIYKWFFPKDRFVVEDFQATKRTPSVLLAKSIKLDAFMEDLVIRRKDVSLPLGKSSQTELTPKVSRKNKDSTGKKIKRSKPVVENKHDSLESHENVKRFLSNNGEFEHRNKSTEDFAVNIYDEDQTKMDVDIVFEGHNNEIKKDSLKKSEDKDEEQETSKVIEIQFNIDINQAPKTDSTMECDTQDNTYKLLNSDNILSQNIKIRYDSDTPDVNDEIADDIVPAKKTINSNEINYKDNQNESENLFSIDALPLSDKSESILENHKTINNNAVTNEIDHKNNKIDSENASAADLSSNEFKDEIKTDNLIEKNSELLNKTNVSENNKTDPKLDGVELKMKQMEELAMKKFKGSFLDKMF